LRPALGKILLQTQKTNQLIANFLLLGSIYVPNYRKKIQTIWILPIFFIFGQFSLCGEFPFTKRQLHTKFKKNQQTVPKIKGESIGPFSLQPGTNKYSNNGCDRHQGSSSPYINNILGQFPFFLKITPKWWKCRQLWND